MQEEVKRQLQEEQIKRQLQEEERKRQENHREELEKIKKNIAAHQKKIEELKAP